MKYKELRDHILGSHLMRHDLEAFLIQSAYLEGLLKYIADFNLFSQTEGKSFEEGKLLSAIKKDIEKYSLANLVDLLQRGNIISSDQKKLLDDYRKKRNNVIHDLLRQVTSGTFDNELRDAYEIGKKIMDTNEFKDMETLLDEMEDKKKEQNDGSDQKAD